MLTLRKQIMVLMVITLFKAWEFFYVQVKII